MGSGGSVGARMVVGGARVVVGAGVVVGAIGGGFVVIGVAVVPLATWGRRYDGHLVKRKVN